MDEVIKEDLDTDEVKEEDFYVDKEEVEDVLEASMVVVAVMVEAVK